MSGTEDPFARARALWEDRHASLAIERDRWRWACFTALGLAALSILLAVWAAVSSRYVPHIVAVDELGQPQPVLAPKTITDWPDETVRHVLASFVRDWRAVSIDAAVLRGRLERIRYFLETNSAAQTKIATWEGNRATNPFRVAEFRTVDVEVMSVNHVGGRSWIVEWVETYRDRGSGKLQQQLRYQGTFTTGQRHIRDERILLFNPMGMVIEDFDVRRVE
ncbi:VirB8/TrbF family protein [Ruegeria atlantica]|uniref:VirB8/TrbF family protein n=1 Tax=Ruegeria atlantica TaxID=81569 RepID=UPI00147F94BA|nr:VirB8/TrbF family protein [Ruegeria atlantica]